MEDDNHRIQQPSRRAKGSGALPAFIENLDAATMDNISKASSRLNKLLSTDEVGVADPRTVTSQVLSSSAASLDRSLIEGGNRGSITSETDEVEEVGQADEGEEEGEDEAQQHDSRGNKRLMQQQKHRRRHSSCASPRLSASSSSFRHKPFTMHPMPSSHTIKNRDFASLRLSSAVAAPSSSSSKALKGLHPRLGLSPFSCSCSSSNSANSKHNCTDSSCSSSSSHRNQERNADGTFSGSSSFSSHHNQDHNKDSRGVFLSGDLVHKVIYSLLGTAKAGQPALAWELCQAIGDMPDTAVGGLCTYAADGRTPSAATPSSMTSSVRLSRNRSSNFIGPHPLKGGDEENEEEESEEGAPDERRSRRTPRRTSVGRPRSLSITTVDRQIRPYRRRSTSSYSNNSSRSATLRQQQQPQQQKSMIASMNHAQHRMDSSSSSSNSIEGIFDDPAESSLTSGSGGWDGPAGKEVVKEPPHSITGAGVMITSASGRVKGERESCRTDWQMRRGGGRRARRRGISDATAATVTTATAGRMSSSMEGGSLLLNQQPSLLHHHHHHQSSSTTSLDGLHQAASCSGLLTPTDKPLAAEQRIDSRPTEVEGKGEATRVERRPYCSIKFIGDGIAKDPLTGKDFVQYAIRVSHGTQSKILYKRYSQFTELDGEISLYCPDYDKELCRLAPKKPWLSFGSTIDPKVTAQRRQIIEKYLNAVMCRRKLRTEPLVQQFLGVSFISSPVPFLRRHEWVGR